jgi:pimeloyl-ACP methyl ester carboxylesterase
MRAADANRSPVVLVGPEHGYGPGGRLFAELLGREHDLVEVGVASAGGAPESLVDRVRVGVEHLRAGGGNPALVGYSLGAVAAAEYAARFPGSLSSLTLIAGWMHPTGKMEAAARLGGALRPSASAEQRPSDEALAAAALLLVSSRAWRTQGPIAPREPTARRDPAAFEVAALMEGCLDRDLSEAADRILDPTLVVACAHDEFAGTEQSHLLFGAIDDARLAEIDSGHAALVERPAEVFEIVRSFIASPREHPPGTRISGPRP